MCPIDFLQSGERKGETKGESAKMGRLRQVEIEELKPGKHQDGEGLSLKVGQSGSRSWVYRVTKRGLTMEIGLGSAKNVTLAQARMKRRAAAALADEGKNIDEIKQAVIPGYARLKKKEAAKKASEEAETWKLANCIARYFELKERSLKRKGKENRWMSPLDCHVIPVLGQSDVRELTAQSVRDCFSREDVWRKKPVAAEKALGRLGQVLRHASVELSQSDLPISNEERIALDHYIVADAKRLLGPQGHVPKHIPSTPVKNIPSVYMGVEALGASSVGLALRLAILTGHRLHPVLNARVEQFDLRNAIWTVPGRNMKGDMNTEDFETPLSKEAVKVVQLAIQAHRNGQLFPGAGKGPVTDRAVEVAFSKLCHIGKPHGLRTALRSWAAEQGIDRELAESLLQHKVGSVVEQAYMRSKLIERRREAFELWAEFVCSERDAKRWAGVKVVG